MSSRFSTWYKSGAPWIWLTAGAVSASLVMVLGILLLIAVNGLHHFWPAHVWEFEVATADGVTGKMLGEIREQETISAARLRDAGETLPDDAGEFVTRYLVKIGNREIYGLDFKWLLEPSIESRYQPPQAVVIERREWGNFYGFVKTIHEGDTLAGEDQQAWQELQDRLRRVNQIHEQIVDLEKSQIGAINYRMERLRLRQRRLELDDALNEKNTSLLNAERAELEQQFAGLQAELDEKYRAINRDTVTLELTDGREVDIKLAQIVRVYQPNNMSWLARVRFYLAKLWEFVSDEPREANTEGGIFPAIFGTVVMVILMSVLVTPFGVVAAVYLREYATQGPLTRLIRIAVNNLAGVPSIVYGVFGLGFFVYFLGGNLDQLFFPEALPAPTFGTPGLLWASLTLALLTLPVVIVATEEGLARIPSSIREGSLALGATKAETLWRTVLPMASPAMMTGLILAVARAAGEVAPLMLVGVVKLAPSLPLDGNFPFIHLDRKFMHLGFHIYDVGFQSPNVEAARPLVYATAFLLVVVIVVLNFAAIKIRNHLREKYRALEQ